MGATLFLAFFFHAIAMMTLVTLLHHPDQGLFSKARIVASQVHHVVLIPPMKKRTIHHILPAPSFAKRPSSPTRGGAPLEGARRPHIIDVPNSNMPTVVDVPSHPAPAVGVGQGQVGPGPGVNGRGGTGNGPGTGGAGSGTGGGSRVYTVIEYDRLGKLGYTALLNPQQKMQMQNLHTWQDVCTMLGIDYQNDLLKRPMVEPFFVHVELPTLYGQDQVHQNEGVVSFQAVVHADGRTDQIQITQSSGNPTFDSIGQSIADSIRWLPALQYGRPVDSTIVFTIRFRQNTYDHSMAPPGPVPEGGPPEGGAPPGGQ